MSAEVSQFLCATDNFGVLLHDPSTGATAAIDVCEEGPYLRVLEEKGWTLTHILVTHHHDDHIAGIPGLKARFSPRVIGPAKDAHRIPGLDEGVREGDTITVGSLQAKVYETPGHTSGHISLFFPQDKLLFAGDTLFSLGCGRLFEGSPFDMLQSLTKLAALPDDTALYCGHEYTLSNARFALTVDPGNAALQERADEVERLRAENRFTLPSTLGREKATNPFLRATDPAIAAQVGLEGHPELDVFTELRARKNRA